MFMLPRFEFRLSYLSWFEHHDKERNKAYWYICESQWFEAMDYLKTFIRVWRTSILWHPEIVQCMMDKTEESFTLFEDIKLICGEEITIDVFLEAVNDCPHGRE